MREIECPNPNPRIVWFLNYAIDEVTARLRNNGEYGEWLGWSLSWKAGRRSPADCVHVAHCCFEHKGWGLDGNGTDPVWHSLAQLAWAAKEACYNTPTSGWLVVRYIADAMIAFGVAFPHDPEPSPSLAILSQSKNDNHSTGADRMSKKLTAGQKQARSIIKSAVQQMLQEVDQWRDGYVEFAADFHLNCVRYDKTTCLGKPCGMNWPIYIHRH